MNGRPVVTHDRCAARWRLQHFGIYVDATSPASTARGLGQALADQGGAFARDAAAYAAQRFSWRAIADSYAEFIRELATTSGHGLNMAAQERR